MKEQYRESAKTENFWELLADKTNKTVLCRID